MKPKSPAEVRRRFNTHQGYKSKSKCAAFTNLKICRIVQHLKENLNHFHKGRSGRRSTITPEKREQVRESMVNSPKKSYRIRAQEVALSPITFLRVMRKDLNLFPFKISTHHVLQQQDKEKTIKMCDLRSVFVSKLPAGLITFGLVIKHTFILIRLLITTTMCFVKRSQKKSVRSTSKVEKSLHLWRSMHSTVCWGLTGSRKIGSPLPSTVSVILPFLTSFTVT